MTRHVWVVPVEAAGRRLDVIVAGEVGATRSRVQHWLEAGLVTVDGEPGRAATRPRGGATVVVEEPVAVPDDRVAAQVGAFGAIVQLDPAFVVLDKPAGLVVHPGAGNRSGTLVNFLLERFPEIEGIGGPGRPGVVHRLDRDTSGLIVLARTAEAYQFLSAAFAARRVAKRYLAVLWGSFSTPFERTDPIGRHPHDRTRMAVRPDGRRAHSRFTPLLVADGITACAVDITTGRTHQIRVHAKAAGHPLVGDPVYGEARGRGLPPGPLRRAVEAFPRPALHAASLAFDHPSGSARVCCTAPIPDDIVTLWATTGSGSLSEALLPVS